MTELCTQPNITNPDDFYARLLDAHKNLSKSESDAFNARLILLLSNHIGNGDILAQAIAAAGFTGAPQPEN